MNKKTIICLGIVLAGYLAFKLLHSAFRNPSTTIWGADLGRVLSIQDCNQSSIHDVESSQPQWKITRFRLASLEQKPQSASSCKLQLETSTGSYPGYFEPKQNLLFFSFLPRYKHGWFTEPEDTEWPRPLYILEAQSDWLKQIGFNPMTALN